MCAPCKIILDAGAAAAFRDEDPDAAMAEAAAKVDLPDDVQDAMSQNDAWLLQQDSASVRPRNGIARRKWRARLLKILGEFAELEFEGAER